ncbi:MAG: hypothetical protein IT165_07530 [Bryobacterales bacterium]|nr:hypothetical protein [Bryobacterales bacterium]
MNIGDKKEFRGYVTKEKFVAGRDLRALEQILGFHAGRFSTGIRIVRLDRLPLLTEFDVAGYSMTAQHHFQRPANLDIERIKAAARGSWSLHGGDRLVKMIPVTAHDDGLSPDFQYPPGLGAPQWRLTSPIPGTVVAHVRTYPAGICRLP